MPGAATECFYTNRARTGVSIQEDCALDARSQCVEQRFAESIRSRPNGKSRKRFEPTAAEPSGDNPHGRYRSAYLDKAIFALPVLLNVMDDMPEFFLRCRFLNQPLRFAARYLENIGITHEIGNAKTWNT